MKPATAGGPYKVPRQHDSWRSITLAVAMHAVLLLFLWIGVSWQNNDPVEVQAEIWDMKVQEAAPTPPPQPEPEPEPQPQPVEKAPPPPPVEAPPVPKEDPEIALQRIKKKKQEEAEKLKQEKLEQARLQKEEDDRLAKLEAKKKAEQKAKDDAAQEQREKDLAEQKAQKKAAAEKLAKEKAEKVAREKAFAAEMSRITGSAAKGSTGTAAQSTGGRVDGGYAAAIKAKIKSNLVYSSEDDSLTASYVITQLPTGEIIGVRKVKGSGSTAYDNAIENAIAKSSPLPKKKDGTVERELTLDFKLKEMH
ncbi:cell envelope integrity protein TolA [Duganella sp. FT80W]|uniref:Cell envelope integrity protein TolA n=1 Tax=Duganella guangzhouensis TaxID=2666084 RepID=A0A6I2L9F2_9BURK|nr:cell envelope integrity protein TolA [Duganella guangzhouensis]MRW94332.1 cell envelope integrity protein TolA [Duganella guangzhouensis]